LAAVPHVRVFAFGSLLNADTWPADVDLLVLYENAADVDLVRALLAPLSSAMPLHVLFLTSAEEAQLRFVEGEKCVPLQ
jgi:hypothetical protein